MTSETSESMTSEPKPLPAADRAGRPYPPEEAERLSKEPFKTFAEPLHEDARNELRGWREPVGAYVMIESTKIHLLPGARKVVGAGLTFVDVSEAPDQQTAIEYHLRKGGRILHWGKFPRLTSDTREEKEKAAMHRNAWDNLERFLKQKLEDARNQGSVQRLEGENDALRRKLAEAEARLREREAKAARAAAKEA